MKIKPSCGRLRGIVLWKREKSYLLLIVSAVLFVISLIVTIYAHGHSYIESTETGAQLSEVRGLLKEIDAGGRR